MYRSNPHYTVTIQQSHESASDARTGNVTIVRAPLPETFMYDQASQYEAPFTQALTGSSILNSMARMVGMKLVTQALTAQIWQGSNETELGLDLEFQTEQDADLDVRQPVLNLMKMVTPSDSNGFLETPGPSLDFRDLISTISSADREQLAEYVSDGSPIAGAIVQRTNLIDTNTSTTDGGNQSNPDNSPAQPGSSLVDQVKRNIKNQISIRVGNFAFFDSVVITNVQKTYTSVPDAISGIPHHVRVSVRFKPLFMVVQSDLEKIFYPPGTASANGRGPIVNPVPSTDPARILRGQL